MRRPTPAATRPRRSRCSIGAPLPNAFPMHAAGFSFPDPARPGLTPVIVQVGTGRAAIRRRTTARRRTRPDAAMVVRVRDEQGREVQKVSQQYLLAGDAEGSGRREEAERFSSIASSICRPASTRWSRSSSTRSRRQGSARVVDADGSATRCLPTLGMSSLVLVRRVEGAERSAARRGSAPTAPLYVGRSLLYPNLGEPIRQGGHGRAAVLLHALRDARRRDGARAAAAQRPRARRRAAAAARASGPRVQHVGRLPIAALPAGTYELRIRVTDGARELSRSAFFTSLDTKRFSMLLSSGLAGSSCPLRRHSDAHFARSFVQTSTHGRGVLQARSCRRRCRSRRRRRCRRRRAWRGAGSPSRSCAGRTSPGFVCSSQTSAGSVRSSTSDPPASSAAATMSRSPSPSRSAAFARWTPGIRASGALDERIARPCSRATGCRDTASRSRRRTYRRASAGRRDRRPCRGRRPGCPTSPSSDAARRR